jgi:methylglyoxal synthase
MPFDITQAFLKFQSLSVAKSPLVTNSAPSCEKSPFDTKSLERICTFSTNPCALTLVAAEFLVKIKSPDKSTFTDTLSIEPTRLP